MASLKSILIIGGSGFIGTHLALMLKEGYKVFATYYQHRVDIPGVTFIPCDVENRNWIKRLIYTSQPDVVIYAAGSQDRQWAEKNPRDAERVHASGPGTVATSTDFIQPKFILISHSYVFDGHRGNYYEDDTALPGTILGKTKLSGENAIKGKSLNYVILRSSPLYGRSNGHRFSFMDRLRWHLDRSLKVEVSTKELHSFAPVHGLCNAVGKLVESGIRNKVLHYGGLTKVTHFDFATRFAKRFGYEPSLIIPKQLDPRKKSSADEQVLDFSLNSTQIIESLKTQPFLLEDGFDLLEKHLVPRT